MTKQTSTAKPTKSNKTQPSTRSKKAKGTTTTPAKPFVMPAPKPAIEQTLNPSAAQLQRLHNFKDSILMKTLTFMLSTKRPHEGSGEYNALGWLLLHKPSYVSWYFDATGNLHMSNVKDKSHRTLFVAHVDTVHNTDGINKIKMTDTVWYAQGSQLGADDGAGVAMLMHLMHAGVPGHYVFTRGEECGGVGAKALADDDRFLRRFDRAIAFDRRGTTSVITHQGYGRCCSDAFAEELVSQLMVHGDALLYMPDDTGVYTDTAEFTGLVPECTNISIGYQREHSHEEAQSILHLQALAEACMQIQWDELPTVRDPNEVEDYCDWRKEVASYNERFGAAVRSVDERPAYDSFSGEDEHELADALRAYIKDPLDRSDLRYELSSAMSSHTDFRGKGYHEVVTEVKDLMGRTLTVEMAQTALAELLIGLPWFEVLDNLYQRMLEAGKN